MGVRIKDHPELRHVLFHLMLAIECVADNQPQAAKYEMEQIWGLLSFDGDDEDFYRFTQCWKGGGLYHGKEEEEMSGQVSVRSDNG